MNKNWSYIMPNTLCEYFWVTTFRMLIFLAISIGSYLCFYVIGEMAYVIFSQNEIKSLEYILTWWSPLFALVGGLVGIAIVAIIYFSLEFSDKIKEKRWNKKQNPQQSLLREYLKNKKNKYCSILEFTDE